MIYQANSLSVQYIEHHIAVLTFHATDGVNKLNQQTLHDLKLALTALKNESELTGLIVKSHHPDFIMGADITEFLSLFSSPEETLDQWLQDANAIFNQLEDLPIPTVSILQGYALGGGCECALATDFRIASTKTTIGLPEVKLGIMPGFGGTVRLPRLLGTDTALELITTGKHLSADQALTLGLIDATIKNDYLLTSAIQLIQQANNQELNWKARRYTKQNPVPLSPTEQVMTFTTAKALVAQKISPHYPAPFTVIKSIKASINLKRDPALDIERQHFLKLTQSSTAHALIRVFLNEQYLKHRAKSYANSTFTSQHSAVIGAGIMGGGIAYQSASKNIKVILKDINTSALEQGRTEARTLFKKQHDRGRLTAEQFAQSFSRITALSEDRCMSDIDIVIEAVTENPKVKIQVLKETEAWITSKTVITSNTSTIPISLMGKHLTRPEQFCGLHFFNPVHRMPLVEVIRGQQTSENTIQRAVNYALQLGKSPIVINDCAGFFVNRVLFPYFAGFMSLLEEGADFQDIDRVMEKEMDWPMGPAQLLDVIGIDTAYHAQAVMAQSYPDRMQKTAINALDILFEQQRWGQKTELGFYRYTTDKKGRLIKHIDTNNPIVFSEKTKAFSTQEIIDRMMIPMMNEVIRCLDEKIIATPMEADIALIYGLGFPPFLGGVFHQLDQEGLVQYQTRTAAYHHLGKLYDVPQSVKDKIKQSETYYPSPRAGEQL